MKAKLLIILSFVAFSVSAQIQNFNTKVKFNNTDLIDISGIDYVYVVGSDGILKRVDKNSFGGGGSVDYGLKYEIPFMNSTNDGFSYSQYFYYDSDFGNFYVRSPFGSGRTGIQGGYINVLDNALLDGINITASSGITGTKYFSKIGSPNAFAQIADIPTLVAGTNVTIDDTDPLNPIINASGGGGLVLGETSTTAYRGDRGKTAYDYSQIGHIPTAEKGANNGVASLNSSGKVPSSQLALVGADFGTNSTGAVNLIPIWNGSSSIWQPFIQYSASVINNTMAARTATGTIKGATATASDDLTRLDQTTTLTGNQTVGGVKTFSSSPIVPTATLSTQAVNLGQLDAAISGNTLQQVLTNGSNTNLSYTVNKVEPENVSSPNIDILFEIKDLSNSNHFMKIGTGYGNVNEVARSGYISLTSINGENTGSYLASDYLFFGDPTDAYVPDSEIQLNKTIYSKNGVFIDGSSIDGTQSSFTSNSINYVKLTEGSLNIVFPENMTGNKVQVLQDKAGTIALTSDVIDILKALPTYNASTPQVLGHDTSGNIQWQAP